MSDVAPGPGRDLTETPLWGCSRAIAHDDRRVTGQQYAITAGEWNRFRNALDIEPAIAARKHGEVGQIRR